MATYTTKGVYSSDNAGVTSPPAEGGERQNLWDVVTRIDPADAPFMNNSPKSTATAVIHDWQVQELAAESLTAVAEGSAIALDGTDSTFVATNRLFNYTTIRRRIYSVSDTMDSVDHAGHAAMSIRQRTLKALEVRKDVEASLMTFTSVKVGATATRQSAGLGTWMEGTSGHVDIGATAATEPTGDGLTALVIGSDAGKNTLARMDGVMQAVYEDGGQPNLMYFTADEKRLFSKLSGTGNELAAQNRFNMTAREPATYIGAVDVYLTDFGTMEAVIDRFQPPNSIYLIDNRHVGYVSMRGRNFKNEQLAKAGDADGSEQSGGNEHDGAAAQTQIDEPREHG